MEKAFTSEGGLNRGWLGFAVTFILAVVYYAACTGVEQYLVRRPDAPLVFKVAACAVVLVPLKIWMVGIAMSRKRADEYQRLLSDRALAWAAQWALLFAVLLTVAHILFPTIQAPGIMTLPGLYFMASVLMGQVIKFRHVEE